MKILSFGEVLWDIYPDKKYIGGAPFNFAAHSAKFGGEVFMLSAVGNDPLGEETIREIEKKKVRTDFVAILPEKPTGRCLVTLDEKGVPQYDLLSDVAYDYIVFPHLKEAFDLLYFGTLALRSEHNKNCLKRLITEQKFGDVFVDINIRPPFFTADSITFAIENATILKISDEELGTVLENVKISDKNYGGICKKLSEKFKNLRLIIITCGENGAFCFDAESGEEFCCSAKETKVVSTVGAGDSFSASFFAEYRKNRSVEGALEFASKISAFVVSQVGAVPEYEIENFKK